MLLYELPKPPRKEIMADTATVTKRLLDHSKAMQKKHGPESEEYKMAFSAWSSYQSLARDQALKEARQNGHFGALAPSSG
jgi:hypothetical protein